MTCIDECPEHDTAFSFTTFENDGRYDEMIVVRDIFFWSRGAGDGEPFHGVVHLAYVPGERIVGLSKLVRLVEHLAGGAHSQQQLTDHIVGAINDHLAPRGAGAIVEARHVPVTPHDTLARAAGTVTLALTGRLHDDRAVRTEFVVATRRTVGAA